MTIAHFSLADPGLAQIIWQNSGKKTPPKRTAVAVSDQKLVPEPR